MKTRLLSVLVTEISLYYIVAIVSGLNIVPSSPPVGVMKAD